MKRACLSLAGLLACSALACRADGPDGSAPPAPGLKFTLKQAEAYALQNHPQIASANLTAEAVRQEIREARSEFFPQVYAESDSVYEPNERTRLAANGGLSSPSLFQHQADGFTVSQLITDFGRTYELTESAHFRASAAQARTNVARAMVVLAVDQAYFGVLRAKAVLRVANETVHARDAAFNQISTLAKNQLKSDLDANFAQLNVSEAQLLQIQAQSGIDEAEARLSTAMGFSQAQHFDLVEEPLDVRLPSSADALVQQALRQRPELSSLSNEVDAAQRFARAQDAEKYPKVSASGAAGVVPAYPGGEHFHPEYVAVGLNIELPVLTGGRLDAQAQQAHFLADAAIKNLVDAQNTISRDVEVAWLDATTARKRLGVTAQMRQIAQQQQKLADARYRLGTSSIVELIQAQLNYTQSELDDTSARYDLEGAQSLLNFTIGTGY